MATSFPSISDGAGAGPNTPASPAPASPDQGSTRMLGLVRQLVQLTRQIAQEAPSTAPIIRDINEKIQQLQVKIVQSSPQEEPAAPPQ